MNITRFSINRPIGITMIVMLFVVLGLYAFSRIGIELLPAVNTPYVTVRVPYPGASPEQIEQEVLKPLENSLSSISNLKSMKSIARSENGYIILEFEFSANADYASIEATKKVNAVRSKLPDGINEPIVLKRDENSSPIMEIVVTSKYPLSDIYSATENNFKESILRASGVSDVELFGWTEKEIAIEVNKDKLWLYKLSLSQIINTLKNENTLLPAGSVYTEKTNTDVRMDAQYKSLNEISQLVFTNANGNKIPITEIAAIREQDPRPTRYSRTNGEPAITMSVYKQSDANIVSTAQAVLKQLDRLHQENPDYQFNVITNSATYINQSLTSTFKTLLEGLFTTSWVLYIFLRGWRSTVAVLLAIPTSLISTFLAMYICGFTFNMMSLLGMILCIGILVDDSIVVLENIFRHLQMGKDSKIAAEDGRNEIGMAAIAITLCDIVVFLPIAFMTGMTGQFFRQFGLTIVFATLFSLFVSFTLTPMLASRLFKNGVQESRGKFWFWLDAFEKKVTDKYAAILCWSFGNSKKVLATVMAIFILSISLIPLGIVGTEYMPRTDEGSFRVYIELPIEKNLDQTDVVVRQMEEFILNIPEVKNCMSNIGRPSANMAMLSVQLSDMKDRKRSIWQITDEVRGFARKNIKNAECRISETQSSVAGVSSSSGSRGGPSSSPIQIELVSSNITNLVNTSYRVQEIVSQVQGIKDIMSTYTEGMPELQLQVDRDKLKLYNTSVSDITNIFSAAIVGKRAGVLANNPNNGGNDTDINVRLQGSDMFKASDLRNIPLQAGSKQLLLGDVAQIKEGTGPTIIQRVDKQRAITIMANITDRPLQEVLNEIKSSLDKENISSSGVTYRFKGQASSMNDTFLEVFQALALSLILIYILLAILYESFSTPFIRMFSLPLGLIGSFLLLALTHNSINLYSLIGILVMDGLVAKNGTLLLDYTKTLMDQGLDARNALIEAGKTRLKAIFMTSLTMITGMLPMALSLSEGTETRVSLAWVIIGGLLTSTVFTLVIIPIIFLYFESKPLKRLVSFLKNYFCTKTKLVYILKNK